MIPKIQDATLALVLDVMNKTFSPEVERLCFTLVENTDEEAELEMHFTKNNTK